MLGIQVPRVEMLPQSLPDYAAGDAAVDLAAACGLHLHAWQKRVLRNSLLQRADGTWAAFEVGLVVSRQNGKGSILEARELAGLFLFNEGLQLHSSHEFKTTIEAFRRIRTLVENAPPEISKQVKRITSSHGEEGIELRNGNRLRFVARSTGSGRGFSVDTVYWDEAYNLGSEAKAALMPTLSSRPNPQLWYTSSAGWGISTALNDVRNRAIKPREDDKRLYFAEWSADPDNYSIDSREDWARANPSLGILIDPDFVEAELAAMRNDPDLFARERLSIGQWPNPEGGWSVIPEGDWLDCYEPRGVMAPGMVLAIDASPDLKTASIAAAGTLYNTNKTLIDVIDYRNDIDWVIPRLMKFVKDTRHRVAGVVVASRGPAGALLADVRSNLQHANKGHLLMVPTAIQEAQACTGFYAGVMKTDQIRHLGQEPLNTALKHVAKKDQNEGMFTWIRRSLSVDICPLYSATLALWGQQALPPRPKPFFLPAGEGQ